MLTVRTAIGPDNRVVGGRVISLNAYHWGLPASLVPLLVRAASDPASSYWLPFARPAGTRRLSNVAWRLEFGRLLQLSF